MAELKGTNIASRIVPFDDKDTFPTHEALYGKGGYRTVNSIADLDTIPDQRLEVGMLVYCKEDESGVHTYRYLGKNESGKRIWKELKLEGIGIPIYTDSQIEEMESKGVTVDEYISIPDDNDIKGSVENKTYETTRNGTYVDILFRAIRALQSEVARLKNSFLYGIESYKGTDTAPSAIMEDLEEAVVEEPLWAIEEDGLSEIYDLFSSDSVTIVNEFDQDYGSVTATENPSNDQYYVTVNNGYVTWDAVEKSNISDITDSKLFFYFTTSGESQEALKFVLHIQEDRRDGTSDTITFDLRRLLKGVSTRSKAYNTLVVLSREQEVAVSPPTTTLPVATEYYGYNYIWVSVSDPETNKVIVEGYWKDGELYMLGDKPISTSNTEEEDGEESDSSNNTPDTIVGELENGVKKVNSIDALIDPGSSDTSENNRAILYDGRLFVKSIDFYKTIISKFRVYSKYQDFSHEVIPSMPTDDTYKMKAAHITIRSVDTYETLKEVKDRLLNNELILVEDKYKLYIKINDKLVAIGSQSGTDDSSEGGKEDDTGMTQSEIISWLEKNGIIVTENGGDLTLNDIADITFKHEATGKTFKFTVNEEGGLDSREVPEKDNNFSEILKKKGLAPKDGCFRGFIAQVNLGNNANTTDNAKLDSDRLKIGSFYAPLSGDLVHGCTHSFIELENTSDKDISLKGVYLHVTKPVFNVSSGSYTQKIYSLELTGIIPSGGTYLIRGARHAEDNDVNAFIKVKTYDQEWYVKDENDANKNVLFSLEILEDIDYVAYKPNFGYAMCLTYGNSEFDGINGKLTPTTTLVTPTSKNNSYNEIMIDDSNKDSLAYIYHKYFIDGLCYYYGLQTESGAYYWAGKNIVGGTGTTMSNTMYRNTFELDPANQAYQALNGYDCSRARWKNTSDYQLVKLGKEFITFPKTEDTYPVSNYTPKASWEHRNVCTDKTKLDPTKPNMVTCSFGINIYKTRCFNWISLGYFDEYIWVTETANSSQPYSEWAKIESYKTVSEDGVEDGSNYPHRREFNKEVNNTIYARLTGRFPADNSFYTAHKVILDIVENPVNTPTEYTYIVGRADKNGNPDLEHISSKQTFTLYPTSYTTKIYQITDQQGFHWIEYQVWAAAADKLNQIIAEDVSESNIIPILINTGDMTQNGTRVNEWYDYYQAGRHLFDHLEQMNCVGNNDLCGTDINALGTGDDDGKSNSYYFHVFYCYEIDSNVFTPICKGLNNTTPKYIPSLYYFDSTTDRFLVVNSEITSTNSKRWFNLTPPNDSGNTKYINIYTGFGFDTRDKNYETYFGNQFTPVYNMIWNILNNAKNNGKSAMAICHEMPFTVITHASLVTKDPKVILTDRSISASKLVGSHLNQINKAEINESDLKKTRKGLYWFSRLLEYFDVKLVIGGHKHTYACTYPIRENYNYVKNGTVVNSLEGGKMEMGESLENDSLKVFQFDGNGNPVKNLTKFPYIKKNDVINPKDSNDFFFPSTNIEGYIEDNSVTSSSDFTTGNIYIVDSNGQFVVAKSYIAGTTYYKKNPECANFKGVVYFMCQATGYKLKSNKELPSIYQTFSKIIPKTTHADSGDTPANEQQDPMFAKITVDDGDYDITLCKMKNILTSNHKFDQSTYSSGDIQLEYLTTRKSPTDVNLERYGSWVVGEETPLFGRNYFTD